MQEPSGADYFREMAEKCRRLAAQTDDPRAIESLKKLAAEYEKAAEAAAINGTLHASGNRPFRRM